MTLKGTLLAIHDAVTNLVLGRRLVERTAENNRRTDARLTELERCVDDVCARTKETAEGLGIDWGPSLASLAKAAAEDPAADVCLPLDANGVPSPEAEQAARARDLRVLYPEQE